MRKTASKTVGGDRLLTEIIFPGLSEQYSDYTPVKHKLVMTVMVGVIPFLHFLQGSIFNSIRHRVRVNVNNESVNTIIFR